MRAPDQTSSLVPVQEIYCVCSDLNAHFINGIADTVKKDTEKR